MMKLLVYEVAQMVSMVYEVAQMVSMVYEVAQMVSMVYEVAQMVSMVYEVADGFFVCVCVYLHTSLYVSNQFNHCIKLFAPCGTLIGNKKILILILIHSINSYDLRGLKQPYVINLSVIWKGSVILDTIYI